MCLIQERCAGTMQWGLTITSRGEEFEEAGSIGAAPDLGEELHILRCGSRLGEDEQEERGNTWEYTVKPLFWCGLSLGCMEQRIKGADNTGFEFQYKSPTFFVQHVKKVSLETISFGMC